MEHVEQNKNFPENERLTRLGNINWYKDLMNRKFKIPDEYRAYLIDEFSRLTSPLNDTQQLDYSTKESSKLLSEFLTCTIGSQEQFRIRKIQSEGNTLSKFFDIAAASVGSRQEGFRFPTSDIDIMLEVPISAQIYQNRPENDESEVHFIIHTHDVKPGFAKIEAKMGDGYLNLPLLLQLMSSSAGGFDFLNTLLKNKIKFQELFIPILKLCLEQDNFMRHLVSSEKLVYLFLKFIKRFGIPFTDNDSMHPHGPCASGGAEEWFEFDLSIGLYCACCHPDISIWSKRIRQYGWPRNDIIQSSLDKGFYLVPIGDKTSRTLPVEWRVSFCKVELDLINSFNHTQMQCYGLLKIFLKQVIESKKEFIDVLSSYCMKTVMFWAVEESSETEWQPEFLIERFEICVKHYLIPWLKQGILPNYVIPGRNLLEGKLENDIGNRLMEHMKSNYNNFMSSINPEPFCIRHLPQTFKLRQYLSRPLSPVRFQEREWEQIHDYTYFVDVLGCFEFPTFLLTFEKCFPPSENAIMETMKSDNTPDHIVNMYGLLCIHEWYKNISKGEPEKMEKEMLLFFENLIFKYIDGDVSSTRLCLATFYLKNKDYKKALQCAKEVDNMMKPYVVHLLSAGLIETRATREIQRDFEYLDKICGHNLTLDEKCKIALARDYCVPPGSILLPNELLLINADKLCHPLRFLQLAPLFYSQFLAFLCQHHMGLSHDRDKTLEQMLNIEQRERVDYWHHTYLIIGICYETMGDYLKALRYFSLSLKVMEEKSIWYYKKSLFVRVALLLLYIFFKE